MLPESNTNLALKNVHSCIINFTYTRQKLVYKFMLDDGKGRSDLKRSARVKNLKEANGMHWMSFCLAVQLINQSTR